jgi:hypothetical protein
MMAESFRFSRRKRVGWRSVQRLLSQPCVFNHILQVIHTLPKCRISLRPTLPSNPPNRVRYVASHNCRGTLPSFVITMSQVNMSTSNSSHIAWIRILDDDFLISIFYLYLPPIFDGDESDQVRAFWGKGMAPRTMVAQTLTSLPKMANPLTWFCILPGSLPRLYMGHTYCRHARPLTLPSTCHRLR